MLLYIYTYDIPGKSTNKIFGGDVWKFHILFCGIRAMLFMGPTSGPECVWPWVFRASPWLGWWFGNQASEYTRKTWRVGPPNASLGVHPKYIDKWNTWQGETTDKLQFSASSFFLIISEPSPGRNRNHLQGCVFNSWSVAWLWPTRTYNGGFSETWEWVAMASITATFQRRKETSARPARRWTQHEL